MNKLFPKIPRQKNNRLALKRRRKYENRLRRKRQKRGINSISKNAPSHLSHSNLQQTNITFSRDIDLYDNENRMSIVNHCKVIRESNSPHLHLNFPMKVIYPQGMLLLYAEIFRKVSENKTKITCNYPQNRIAEQVLQHINFFKLIKKTERIPADEIQKAPLNVHTWRVTKGIILDGFDGKKVSEFLDQIGGISESHHENIHIAMSELIGNAIEHAYEKNDLLGHWVMFGRINEENELIVVVGDLGRTIPYTIKERPDYIFRVNNYIREFKTITKNDSGLINLAVTIGQTHTRELHRGKGLAIAIQHIKEIGGNLSIYSRDGVFPHESLSRKAKRKIKVPINPIQGTIIQISIPMESNL